LLAGLEESVAAGTLILQPIADDAAKAAAPDGIEVRHILAEELDEALQGLARAALLVA